MDRSQADWPIVSQVLLPALFEDYSDTSFPPVFKHHSHSPWLFKDSTEWFAKHFCQLPLKRSSSCCPWPPLPDFIPSVTWALSLHPCIPWQYSHISPKWSDAFSTCHKLFPFKFFHYLLAHPCGSLITFAWFQTLMNASILSLEEVVLECHPAPLGPLTFQYYYPWDISKYLYTSELALLQRVLESYLLPYFIHVRSQTPLFHSHCIQGYLQNSHSQPVLPCSYKQDPAAHLSSSAPPPSVSKLSSTISTVHACWCFFSSSHQ